MKKRVLYSCFNNKGMDYIIDYCRNQYDWKPVLFHFKDEMKEWSNRVYPDVVFSSTTQIRQGEFDYSDLGQLAPLDADILAALAPYETNALSWFEDTTGWNFSFHERRTYYYEVLKYWNTVIQNLKPEMFIAFTWPHLPSDYPLYLLCKYYYNLPVLFMSPVPLLNEEYFYINNSLENLSERFESVYFSDDNLEISDDVEKYLDSLRSNSPEIPCHIKEYWLRLAQADKKRYIDFLRMVKLVLTGRGFQKSNLSFKKNQKPWDSDDSKLTHLDYYFFKEQLRQKNNKNKKIYDRLAEDADLSKKYIYFPGPYQPEVPSNLCAGVYEDVFLVLDMLTQLLPDDWMIYYKEHPNSFKENDKGALWRNQNFFERINKYKKVRIVSTDCDTFVLADNAKAVCTIGGTAGWEAIVRGKPAIFFGSIWYQSCKSVFTIKNYKDAKNAIEKIIAGYLPDPNDVDRFAQSIKLSSELNLLTSNYFDEMLASSENPQLEMERIAKAFYNAYQYFYKRSPHETVCG